MPKKPLSITLSAEQADTLRASFGSSGVDVTDDQLNNLARLALDSWIDLFSGRKRYRSLTEQYLDWLDQIYSSVLKDEEPGERRLFSQFHFPYGQTQYLSRILRRQRLRALRRTALESLKRKLEPRLDEAKKWTKEGRGDERMVFTISKGARAELDGILSTLSEANVAGIAPIKTEGNIGSHVSVSIAASNVPLLLT